ncbi:hypothetical protein ACOMHN_047675 [Nucella lapillus]
MIVLLLDLFCQVLSDYCGNDQYCQSPYKCCANSMDCCYDHSRSSYLRGFKLHVWNMWYFWLVVIFFMMSCFGGCGYYRRQRLAAMQQTTTATPTVAHRVCVTRQMRSGPRSGLYAYTGPGADTGSSVALPPPYTEVMQQPSLYPVNKVDLPPYPGPPANKDASQVSEAEEVSPPPYCEVAMPSGQQRCERVDISRHAEHASVPVESNNQANSVANSVISPQATGLR